MGAESSDKRSDAEVIASIKSHIEKIEGYRVQQFPPVEMKPGAKLLRLVALWKSGLAFRLVDIAEASLAFFSSGRIVPGCILARSAAETIAGVNMLSRRILEIKKSEQFEELFEFLMQLAFGSRDQSSNYKALNVLTMLNHLDKKFGIVMSQYDHLSEYTHPNLKGGLMAYSKIGGESLSAELGINPGALPVVPFGMGQLELILMIGNDVYEALEKASNRVSTSLS